MTVINGNRIDSERTAGLHLRGVAREILEAKAQHERYSQAIRTLARHVTAAPDGGLELRVRRPRDAGVDPDLFEELQRSLAVGDGSPGHRTGLEAAAGADHLHVHWWGVETALDDATTHRLVDAAHKSPAAVAAVLVGLGLTMPVAAAIGGSLFGLAGRLGAVCAYGGHHGLIVHRTWAGKVWVWHR